MTRPPDKAGQTAQAWELTPARAKEIGGDWKPDWDASIGTYFVQGPFHPFWSWWVIACVHLRQIKDVQPAQKQYLEAQYEFGIWSLQSPPEGPPFDPDRDDATWSTRVLQPADVIKQFDFGEAMPVEQRDAAARKLLDEAIALIVDGKASPDSDNRRWWNAAIDNAVEHELTGGHFPKGRLS